MTKFLTSLLMTQCLGCTSMLGGAMLNFRLPLEDRAAYCTMISFQAGKNDVCSNAVDSHLLQYSEIVTNKAYKAKFDKCMARNWEMCSLGMITEKTNLMWCPYTTHAEMLVQCSLLTPPEKAELAVVYAKCELTADQAMLKALKSINCYAQWND